MTVAILLFALACTPEPPTVSGITPASGPAGTAVTITGSNFAEGTTARLGGQTLDELSITSPTELSGKVPASVKPGPTDLVVQSPGGQAAISKAYTLSIPEPEGPPCKSKERRMTSIGTQKDVVKIDRYPDGQDEPVRSQYPVRDIERVLLENTMMDGDERCSAIYLGLKAGGRVLFDADSSMDLRGQAQKIGNGLGKPVDVAKDEWPAEQPAAE
jgi:hypothetical protein